MILIIVGIILFSVLNYFLITTIVDICLMGGLLWQIEPKVKDRRIIITRKNRIDIQTGYVYPKGLRHMLKSYDFKVKYCRGNLAESLPELVNCDSEFYNRKVEINEFMKLWNTAMIRQPFYKNTYMRIMG